MCLWPLPDCSSTCIVARFSSGDHHDWCQSAWSSVTDGILNRSKYRNCSSVYPSQGPHSHNSFSALCTNGRNSFSQSSKITIHNHGWRQRGWQSIDEIHLVNIHALCRIVQAISVMVLVAHPEDGMHTSSVDYESSEDWFASWTAVSVQWILTPRYTPSHEVVLVLSRHNTNLAQNSTFRR